MPCRDVTVDAARNRYFCLIAGSIELIVGAYFTTFGSLAAVYFERMHHPNVALLSAAGALLGILLVFRARRLLGWGRWLCWLVILPLLVVPVVWFGPALLQ